MKSFFSSPALHSILALIGASPLLHAGVRPEIEENGTFATATAIFNGDFAPNSNPNVFGTVGTVALTGTVTPANVDFFKFEGIAGSTIYADVDNDPFTSDTDLWLFNGSGFLIAFVNGSSSVDPGSASSTDSFLGMVTLPLTGTYYLAVTNGRMAPNTYYSETLGAALLRPDGEVAGVAVSGGFDGDGFYYDVENPGISGAYTIYLSNSAVPEPATWASALGLLSMAGFARRRFPI